MSEPAGWLSGLGALPWGRRLAVGAVVPVAGLALLQWLSAAARVRYDIPVHATDEPSADAHDGHDAHDAHDGLEPGESVPVLSQPDLWRRWRLAERTAYAHLAAGLALVAGTLAAAGVWGAEPRCRRVPDLSDGVCWSTMGGRWPYAGLLLAGGRRARRCRGPAGRQTLRAAARHGGATSSRPRALLWAVGSGVLLIGTVAALWFEAADPADPSVPGLSVVPSALVARDAADRARGTDLAPWACARGRGDGRLRGARRRRGVGGMADRCARHRPGDRGRSIGGGGVCSLCWRPGPGPWAGNRA